MVKIVDKAERKLNQEEIKKSNRESILKCFRTHQILKKQDLVELLDLSITTVTTNVRELVEEGYLSEKGIADSTGGRKPIILEFEKNSRYGFGADISSTKLGIIAMNLSSEKIDGKEIEITEECTLDRILSTLQTEIESMISENGLDKEKCLGLGISLHGVVDESKKVLLNAPNMGVSNYSFKDFESSLGMPVYIENEANIAAFGERVLGNAKDCDNVVFVSITEGLGCGIINYGKILKSIYKKAGEFGHMRISSKGDKCNCGRTGCWEIYASERALEKLGSEILGKTIEIGEIFKLETKLLDMILDKYFNYLSIGIENIDMALDPEMIIIGGRISKHLSEMNIQIQDRIKFESLISKQSSQIITYSKFLDMGPLYGASLLPLTVIFNF